MSSDLTAWAAANEGGEGTAGATNTQNGTGVMKTE